MTADTPQQTLHAATQLAGKMPALLLEADRVAQTFMRGVHGRRKTGQGETFWQFRPYQAGDAPRDIDWRQSAKRDEVFTRQLEWEAAQTLWLYRDPSASMNFSPSARLKTKKEYAEILLLALSIAALAGGEQVALLGAGLRPQAHERAIERIFEYLPQQKDLQEGAAPVSAQSNVLLISDFYMPLPPLAAFCGDLAQRGARGVLLQICDPAEETLPYDGRVRFQDAETGAEQLISDVSAIRADYAEKFAAHRVALGDMARALGWQFLTARTDEKPEDVLLRLHNRMATGSGA